MNLKCGALAIVLLVLLAAPARAQRPDPRIEAFWTLLHESIVIDELKLSPEQKSKFFALRDDWDLRYFRTRNQKREVARPAVVALVAEAREATAGILNDRQRQRLLEIEFRRMGTGSFLMPEMDPVLRLTDDLKSQITTIMAENREAEKQAYIKSREEKATPSVVEARIKALRIAEQRKVLAKLSPAQQEAWKRNLGEKFDVDRLGFPTFRAPDLIDSGQWVNSEGVTSESLRGKVVVVHFYAFGCINCIHNYPAYLDWQSRFKGRDFAIIGIHRPETQAEKDIEEVKRKAAAEKFEFPVLIDVEDQNWDAWGNSIWPSVYLIDKQGRLRYLWTGELNWQGATGEAEMRKHIEELLAEKKT